MPKLRLITNPKLVSTRDTRDGVVGAVAISVVWSAPDTFDPAANGLAVRHLKRLFWPHLRES